MNSRHDYYDVLRLTPGATSDDIRASYCTIVQRLSADPRAASEYASLTVINEAFRTLGDPADRADYDRQRATVTSAPATTLPACPHAISGHAPTVEPAMAHCSFCEAAVGATLSDSPDGECPVCGAALFPAQQHTRRAGSRRAMDRLPMQMRASFQRAATGPELHKGVSQDISLAGMRLIAAVELTVDERISVSCDFGSAVGIVRHVRRPNPGIWECGIQFVTLHVRHLRGGQLSTVA